MLPSLENASPLEILKEKRETLEQGLLSRFTPAPSAIHYGLKVGAWILLVVILIGFSVGVSL